MAAMRCLCGALRCCNAAMLERWGEGTALECQAELHVGGLAGGIISLKPIYNAKHGAYAMSADNGTERVTYYMRWPVIFGRISEDM